MKFSPVSLLRFRATLAEGPCWHPEEQALYFTDIPAGRIWRFDSKSQQADIFYEGFITGGFTLQAAGGWVLFQEKGLTWLDAQGKVKRSLPVNLSGTTRFNDVIADPSGHVYAGTVGETSTSGGLYRFGPEGRYERLFQGTQIANGMAFSPCGQHLYWTCTTSRIIYRFDYDPISGGLSNRVPFHRCPPENGLPDGLVSDQEGKLWSARWGAGLVVILSAEGNEIGQIRLSESNITSLSWGGAKLQDLYITAARGEGLPGVHDLFVIPDAGQGLAENRSLL